MMDRLLDKYLGPWGNPTHRSFVVRHYCLVEAFYIAIGGIWLLLVAWLLASSWTSIFRVSQVKAWLVFGSVFLVIFRWVGMLKHPIGQSLCSRAIKEQILKRVGVLLLLGAAIIVSFWEATNF